MFRKLLLAASLLPAAAAFTGAHAQDFPSKQITVVVPFAPGGATDLLARLYAEKLQAELAQPVVVDNRPGATALVGMTHVANSPADGYTLLYGGIGSVAPMFFKDPPINVLEALTPVARVVTGNTIIFISKKLPVEDFKGMINYAKENPGGVNYGYAATTTMLPLELLKVNAGIEMAGAQFRGAAAVTTAMLSGEVHVSIDTLVNNKAHIAAGTMFAAAVLGEKRLTDIPDTPTIVELGFPDMVVTYNNGFWAPKGTPAAVVERLNQAINKVTALPDVTERIQSIGGIAVAESPEKLLEAVVAEVATHQLAKDKSGWVPAN